MAASHARSKCILSPKKVLLGMKRKAQTTVELMVIMAIGLVVVASLVGFVGNQIAILQETQAQKTAQASMNDLIAGINEVYAQGPGAAKQITVIWPAGIDASLSSISNKSIRLRVYKSDVVGTAIPYITGSLPTLAGTQRISVRAADGFVSVGTLTLSASPSSVYLPMARDQNTTTTIRLSSSSSTSSTVTPSLTWNHSLVSATTSSTSFSISSAADVNKVIDVNAGPLAVGNYSGAYQISASFADHLESLRIPLDVEVLLSTGTLLTPYPSSLNVNLLWDDSNSSIVQLCNLGTVAMKSIAFIPSTGNAGDWVQGIDTIDLLDSQTCQSVTVTVTPPNGTGLGTYYGTIVLRDFDGTNTLAIPLTVNVLGMSGAFAWDWNVAVISNSAITNYGLANTGSNPIILTTVTISQWNACDSNQNHLTGIGFNNSTRFSGSNAAGVVADINDFTIPVLGYYSDNNLSFSGRINDENEQFIAHVAFSDGTTYTSGVFGLGGCGTDTTAPQPIEDLLAVPGPHPGSVLLTFLFPGDDNFSGRAAEGAFRYRENRVNDAVTWGLAYDLLYDFNIGTGSSDANILVYGVPLSTGWYFGARFADEVPNYAYSNSPQSAAGNSFSMGDLDFPHMLASDELSSLLLETVDFSTGTYPVRNIRIRIQDENYALGAAGTGRWIMDINFGTEGGDHINLISFSYNGFGDSGEFGYDWNTGPMNDLWPVDIMGYEENLSSCESRTYQCLSVLGINAGIEKPNHVYLDEALGIDDFTFSVGAGDGG